MTLQGKKIAIVGGGPGGLTLARLLQLAGADITVYERDADKSARVQGAPLDLHETSGLAALAKAGLMQAFKDNFMPGADRMKIMDEHATVFYSNHDTKQAENFGHPHFRPEIDRGVLRRILLGSLQPGTILWGSHFLDMQQEAAGWRLNFKDRPSAYADIVIAADGARSKLRPYVTGIKAFYTGITMLEGNIYDAQTAAPHMAALLASGKIMAFGKGQDLLMGQKADGEIGFYASFKADAGWAQQSGLDFADRAAVLQWFRAAYPDWSSLWHELFERATLPFIPRPIYCMPLDQSWAALPNLTLIGDAAHLMPPFAGEGVNMAMLDALELSTCLTEGDYATVHEAIAAYEARMRSRASAIARESLDNGERMHSATALATMLDFFGGH